MPKGRIILLVVILQLVFSSLALASDTGVPILCYHDVGGNINNEYTVTKETLISHLSYLKANGYHPISLEQYIAFTKNGAPLPEKPVMLTFDDGYISFYNEVFPLLKQYNYPAVFAIVGSWLEYAPSDLGQLVNWQQLREMEASGLVEIASHSFRSHRFTVMNPQGDRGELLSTLAYTNDRYETTDEFYKRVYEDLEQSQKKFEQELGHKVRALVWPYGEYNLPAIEIAKKMGFESMLALGGGINAAGQKSLVEARRGIIMGNPNTSLFSSFVKSGGLENKPMKAAYLDIDAIYEPNNLRGTDNNLNLAIARFYKAGINTVVLKVLSEESGSNTERAYFHTTVIPVKADIFSHIASRLRNEGFLVYATMPTLSSQWLIKEHPEDQVITNVIQNSNQYRKATPFSPVVQKKLLDLYKDLGAYTYVDGVIFEDELYLMEEDFSPAAKAAFQNQFGKELTTEVLKDDSIRSQWVKVKMETIQNLRTQLMKGVQTYRPYTLFARSISAEALLDKKNGKEYGENYNRYLNSYDYTVIKTPLLSDKQTDKGLQWLGNLAETVLVDSGAANKVTFELQTFDGNKNAWISDKDLKANIAILRSKGAIHFIYNPDVAF